MGTTVDFTARFVKAHHPPEHESLIALYSNGVSLELHRRKTRLPVYSVIDGNGYIVRTMQSWLRHLTSQVGLGISPNTLIQYGRRLTYLARWIEREGPYPNLSIDQVVAVITRGDLTAWLTYMGEHGAESLTTLHSREACVRQFLDWLSTFEGGRVRSEDDSPWRGHDGGRYVTRVPSPNSPKYIATELIVLLFRGFHNECERCMFHTQYDMGLRIEELTQLTLKDLPNVKHYNAACEFIPVSLMGNKGRAGRAKQRLTIVSRAVLRRIARYHSSLEYQLADGWGINDPDKPWFLTTNGKPWALRNASKQFKAAVRRQGLSDDFSTHWMRHGTAFSVLRSDMGKTLEERFLALQQILGHANLTTTQIYTQISPALLVNLTEHGREIDRLAEAEDIRKQTFLGQNQHRERRGHRA